MSSKEFWLLRPSEYAILRERTTVPDRLAWRRTATLIAYTVMTHVGGDFTPDQFDPYAEFEKIEEKSPQQLLDVIVGLNARLGGEDKRPPEKRKN